MILGSRPGGLLVGTLDESEYQSNQDFNEWLDYNCEYGEEIVIQGVSFLPSYILFRLDLPAYRDAWMEYCTERDEWATDMVCNSYPYPIAHYFYRSEYGSENPLQQLTFLKDTWESLIFLMCALVAGEARERQISLASAPKITWASLTSEKVGTRIRFVKRVLEFVTDAGQDFSCAKLFGPDHIDKLLDFNQERNELFHTAGKSEKQARENIEILRPDLLALLVEIQGLGDIELLRYVANEGLDLKFQPLTGHSNTVTFRHLTMTVEQMTQSSLHLQKNKILAQVAGRLFCMEPCLTLDEHDGHHPKLLILKKKIKGTGNWEFEIVGDSKKIERPRSDFTLDTNAIRRVLGAPPEDSG